MILQSQEHSESFPRKEKKVIGNTIFFFVYFRQCAINSEILKKFSFFLAKNKKNSKDIQEIKNKEFNCLT